MIAFCQLPAICVAHQWDVVMFPLIFGTSMIIYVLHPHLTLEYVGRTKAITIRIVGLFN